MPHTMSQPTTVLIITEGQDEHARAVRDELITRGAVVWTWDVSGFPRSTPFSIHFDPASPKPVHGTLTTAQGELLLDTVTAVWMRRNMLGLFAPRERPDDVGVFVGFELDAAFRGISDALRQAKWVNPPDALYAIEPEIAQKNAAQKAGFQLTADASAANLKVVVVDSRVFSFESQASGEYQVAQLPDNIRAACISLVQTSGLVLASIELGRNTDGEYVFLGLKANPDWLAIEQSTGAAITASVADSLQS